MSFKTIIISILILIVLNYIIHFLKDSFTTPITKYLDTPKDMPKEICENEKSKYKMDIDKIDKINKIDKVKKEPIESKDIEITETEMKTELNDFLLSINI